jgi:hypothetical protein
MSDKRHDREIFANALKQVHLNESKIELNNNGDIVFNNKQPINELLGTIIGGALIAGVAGFKAKQIYDANKAANKKAADEADKAALDKQNILSSIEDRKAAADHRTAALEQQRKEASKNRRADRRARGSNRKQANTIAQNANNTTLDAARIKAAAALAAAGLTPPPPPTP